MSTPPGPGFTPSFETCTDVTPWCPVEITTYGDYFSLGACAFFVAFFTLLLIGQIYLGARGRTWVFSGFLGVATVFEIMGYGARIAMSPIGTVWNYDAFVIQLVLLILAPTFAAAAISVTFKWIVIQCGEEYSVIRPKWYPWVFLGTDFTSIVIQAIGGAISAVATDGDNMNQSLLDVGSGLLTAGTAFQLANMVGCGMLIVIYGWRYRRAHLRAASATHAKANALAASSPGASGTASPNQDVDVAPTSGTGSAGAARPLGPYKWKPNSQFRVFLWAIAAAYMAIITRCAYRIPEMSLGWGSRLMQTETLFLIFDGGAVAFATLALTVFHPTLFFPILCKPSRAERKQGITARDAAGEKRVGTAEADAEAGMGEGSDAIETGAARAGRM